jgi:hypothetical protein
LKKFKSCIFNEHSPNRTWTHCVLSETWLDEAEIVYLKEFDVARKGRNERADGGVAIYINNKLK